MRCLVPALAIVLASFASAQNPANSVRFVPPDGRDPAALVQGLGTVLNPEGRAYILRAGPGLTPELAAQRLRQAGAEASPVWRPRIEGSAPLVPAGAKQPGWYLSYRERHMQRAYPFQGIDPRQMPRALAARATMPAFRPKTSAGAIGGTWSFLGPVGLPTPYRQYFGDAPIAGRVNGLAWDPFNSATFYAATAGGGVWKTTNGGSTWAFLSQSWPSLWTTCVAVDPNSASTLYVGTGDFWAGSDQPGGGISPGFGLMKSTDGGTTWTVKGAVTLGGRTISDVWINPANSRTIVVTTGRDGLGGLIFRSTDGGDTWTAATTLVTDYNGLSMGAISASASPLLYASGSGSSGGVLLRSANQGATWTPVNRPTSVFEGILGVAASKSQPNTVYALCGTSQGIYRSTDAGTTWQSIKNNFPNGGFVGTSPVYNWTQAGYDFVIETSTRSTQNGAQDVIYVGLIDIVKSADGGASWGSIGGPCFDVLYSRVHSDQHAVAINPNNPSDVLLGSDGGAYRYNESTNTTQSLNRNLGITQYYAADWDNTEPLYLMAGAQDNSTTFLDRGTWRNVIGGDGGGAVIDPRNRAVMFGADQGGISKTDTTWTFSGGVGIPWAGEDRTFVPRLYMDPNNAQNVFTASTFGYRIDNVFLGGVTKLGGPNAPSRIWDFEVAKGDSQRMVAVANGFVGISMDGGATWSDITLGLPNRTVSSVSIDPLNKNDILVTLSGNVGAHVWRCANSNVIGPTWTPVSGTGATSLPNVPTNCLERDPADPQRTWYVGTDIGVFVTTDAGATWFDASQPLGLPNVTVTAMEAVPATGFLNIATYGRGLWRLPIGAPAAALSSVSLVPNFVYGGLPSTAVIRLSRPAPYPGLTVALSTTGPVTAPATATFPPGADRAEVRVETQPVSTATTATVAATYRGVEKVGNLYVRAPILYSVMTVPFRITPPGRITGYLTFLGVPVGADVTLTSNSQHAIVPSAVKTGQGGTQIQFPIDTIPTPNDEIVTVKAVWNGRAVSSQFSVYAPQLRLFSPNAAVYQAGSSGWLEVALSGPAPAGGVAVTLKASPSSLLKMPATVTIPEGGSQTTVKFTAGTPTATSKVYLSASTSRATRLATISISP